MSKLSSFAVLAVAFVATTVAANTASAMDPYLWPNNRARLYPWHGNYAHSSYGAPVAMVVPPTANLQTDWGWGVGSSRISRIDHQFGRDYPGPGPFGGGFMMTPRWPHDTTNFGVYNVRGPW